MNDPARPVLPPRRARRRLALGALVLLGAMMLALGWLLGTGSGLRFALARASAATGGAFSVGRADGRLLGPVTVRQLRYHDVQGLDVRVERAQLDVSLWALLRRQLHVHELDADGIAIALPPPAAAAASGGSFDLRPPLDVQVDRLHAGALRITRGGRSLFAADRIDLAGRWTGRGIALHRLDLAGPDGEVHLNGELASAGYRGHGDGRFDWTLGGTRWSGQLQARGDGRQATLRLMLAKPAAATLQLTLEQQGDDPWSATLEAPRFDPAPILGPGRLRTLALSLKARGDRRGGRIEGTVQLDDTTVQLQPLRARLSDNLDTLQLEQLAVASPQIPGTLQASGRLQLAATPMSANLSLRWQGVTLPKELVGQALASDGSIDARGSLQRFEAHGNVTVGPPGQPAHLSIDLDGTPASITLHTLALKQAKGQLLARGTLDLHPVPGWRLDVQAQDFDPGELAAGWPGAINAELHARGRRTAAGWDASLALQRLAGRLRQRAIGGHGELHLSPAGVVDGSLDLASGDSRLHVEGKPGPRNDARLRLAIASLADWLPDAGGQLRGELAVRGPFPGLSVNGTVQGERLAWRGNRLDRLHLVVGLPDLNRLAGKIDLQGRGLLAGGLAFDRLHLRAEGSEASHRFELDAAGRQLSGRLALDGSLRGGAWTGQLASLDLAPEGLPRWQLQHHTPLAYRDGGWRIGELCLTAGDPLLCASASRDRAGTLDASYRLRALPLALVLNAAGLADLPIRADGVLEGDGRVKRTADGALTGHATIGSGNGSISYVDHGDHPLLAYRDLELEARLDPTHQRATVQARLDDGGHLDGQVTMSGPRQALDGQVDVQLGQLGFVELLTSELANVKGALAGRVGIGGTLDAPTLAGQATVDGFAAEVPAAGLKLADGHLALDTDDARQLHVDGSLRSGKGTLDVRGTVGLGADASTELVLQGAQVTAADLPAARVVVSPTLVLKQDAQGIDLTGRVALDSADIDVARLPGAGATKASPDVVVMDAQAQEAKAKAMPISATVAVDLGERTHLVGMGLDGNLRGQLVVRERPGRATTGQGQVDVSGTYRAYGQNLSIERGQLLFATTPIDNPRLDIRAVRRLNPNATVDEGRKVGLYVSGTAQRPVLSVFSQPVMEQSDALSYLITGKPLSEVKGGEGSMVNSAAQALGSAGGDLLAKRIGSQLGVDEIGVSSNEALNGSSAFTVGKYLSPRLYLSYGVGLFEPGQVVTLRYRLSKRWSFEAQDATTFSRASFNYRLER
ncbi:MAG: translocation/assembly module TamB domain-containing protein [Xanthomonadaceae bacterium]|nr:translocation/assembly module TamB domain-containing protein [Xanthomonadaceae bacterium]MDE1963906.1 translocation/assembly module TamB domain-containing protein [Xanthomonadaceae bacterium]